MSLFKKITDVAEKLPLVKETPKPLIDWSASIRRVYKPGDYSFVYSIRDEAPVYLGKLSHDTEFRFLVSEGHSLSLYNEFGLSSNGYAEIENYKRAWYVDSFGDVQYTDDPDRQSKLAQFYATESEAKAAAK